VLVGAVALLLTACASAGSATPDPFGDETEQDILVTVHNNDRRPATIYAYWDGLRQRVGSVTGNKTQTFRVRWRNDRVQIGHELLASRAVGGASDYADSGRSQSIFVSRGDHLNYVIQARGELDPIP